MTNSARLGPMLDTAAGETEDLASFDGPAADSRALPWAVPPSDPRVWAHRRDLDPTVRRLAEEFVAGRDPRRGLDGRGVAPAGRR